LYFRNVPDKISQAQSAVERLNLKLAKNRPVYEEILRFYSDGALIESNIADLEELLLHKEIKVYKTNAKSFEECVYDLLDNYSVAAAKGMLRYYEAGNFEWPECEKAEIAIGDALAQDIYGWQPDAWTVFKKEGEGVNLTAIVAV